VELFEVHAGRDTRYGKRFIKGYPITTVLQSRMRASALRQRRFLRRKQGYGSAQPGLFHGAYRADLASTSMLRANSGHTLIVSGSGCARSITESPVGDATVLR